MTSTLQKPTRLARVAGVAYLLVTGAAFNEGFVLPHIVRAGDAAGTAANIRASATLFRLGFLGDLVAGTCWLLTAMVLYLLLRHVSRPAAAAMVTFAAAGAAIQCLNQLSQYLALTVATSDDYTRTFGKPGVDGLALLFTDMQRNGYAIDAMFFGLWLVPLGYLVIRSGYVPRLIGVLQIVACAGYLTGMFAGFLDPALGKTVSSFVVYPAGAAGELPFIAWLLIKGVRTPEAVPATAAGTPASRQLSSGDGRPTSAAA